MFFPRRSAALAALALLFLNGCAALPWREQARHQVLWEVRDAGHVVYLMGAVHVMPKSVYPLDRRLEAAFAEAEELVLEIDLSERSDQDVAAELERLGKYPPGDVLANHLSEPARAFLTEVLPAFNLTFEQAQPYRPWFLADVLSAQYLHQSGLRAENGVDNYFLRKAEKAGKRIAGLEEVKAQTNITSGDTDAEAEAYLINTVATLEPVAQTVHAMSEAWRRGDLQALTALIDLQANEDPRTNERMFTARNRNWLPAIERRIKGNRSSLIIVGAGHLIGREGIVAMLRARGYNVQRL